MNVTGVFAAVCAYFAHVIVITQSKYVIITVMSEDSVHFDLCNLRPEFSDTCYDVMLKQVKGKAMPLQAWTGPEGSRRLRLPDFKTLDT